MNYHAHIYFDSSQLPLVESLARLIKTIPCMQIQGLFLRPVGPHAKPMLEIHFQLKDRPWVIDWLRQQHQNLSVLIHADSGDDFRDHAAENILWVGDELPIDFSFFEKVKLDTSLALH